MVANPGEIRPRRHSHVRPHRADLFTPRPPAGNLSSLEADPHTRARCSHISDQRQPADANRIADPQDILGSVLVQNSHLVPDSYEPNHVAYRLVTEAGLMRLPGGLGERLREACERVWELEREAAAEEAAEEAAASSAAAAEQSQQ